MKVVEIVDRGINIGLRSRDTLIQKGKSGLLHMGRALTDLGTEEVREVVTEEDISLDDLKGGLAFSGVDLTADLSLEEAEVEVVSVKTPKPGHVFVEISAQKGSVNKQITEEEIPIKELQKMFPQFKGAAPGVAIPVSF